MLAVVKEPHIEMCLNGDAAGMALLIDVLRRSFDVDVVCDSQTNPQDDDEEYVNIEETDWWKEMNTPGNLLAGCRLKHNLTQVQLAKLAGMSYAVISAYEHDRRKITPLAARRLAAALGEDPDKFYDKLMGL